MARATRRTIEALCRAGGKEENTAGRGCPILDTVLGRQYPVGCDSHPGANLFTYCRCLRLGAVKQYDVGEAVATIGTSGPVIAHKGTIPLCEVDGCWRATTNIVRRL